METQEIKSLTQHLKSLKSLDSIKFGRWSGTPYEIPIIKDADIKDVERASAFAELLQEIEKIPEIEEVSLIQGALAPKEISQLFAALAKSDNINKRLSIWNQLPRQTIPMLAGYIKNSKNLKELHIDDNSKGEISIDDASLAGLAKGIAQNYSLKWLCLSDLTGSPQFYTTIAEILRNNEAIEELSIHDCRSNTGIAAIAEGLQNNTTLKKLEFSRANLGSDGVTVLVQCLENNRALTYLCLHNDDLTHGYKQEGIQAIAQLLKNNAMIESLILDRCNIGDIGATIIGEALQYNERLEYINLDNNGIGDRGIIAIAQGLEQNNMFRFLHIRSDKFRYRDGSSTPNHIGVSGAKALRKLLEGNPTVRSLDMNHSYGQSSWEISPVIAEIAAGLKNNHTLSDLRIDEDVMPKELYLSSTDAKILAKAIIASGNKNLLRCGSFRPDMDSLDSPDPEVVANLNKIHDYCEQNWNRAQALLAKIREYPEELTLDDVRECKERKNALLYLAPELEAEIPALLQRRAEEIQRQTALQIRRATNDRVIHDLSHYAQDNGLTFEQMCREIALYRTEQFRDPEQALSKMDG